LGGTIDLCTCTLTVDQSGDTSYAGTIIGTGGGGFLTKDGSGTLALSGANTYSGGTNVDAGTLSISSDANLGTGGTVNLAEGTTLAFTAGGIYTHDVTVTGDPIFDTNGNTVTENGQITDGGSPPSGG
jgi:autotransporter-associated beta strand protein